MLNRTSFHRDDIPKMQAAKSGMVKTLVTREKLKNGSHYAIIGFWKQLKQGEEAEDGDEQMHCYCFFFVKDPVRI